MRPCNDILAALDDYLDARLLPDRRAAVSAHLGTCSHCRQHYARGIELQAALRELPAPPVRRGFAEEALAAARRAATPRMRHTHRAVVTFALAATLVLGLALGVLFGERHAAEPAPSVVLTAEQPQTVRLVFTSAKRLEGATLTLELPENVELAGYGNRRQLSWETPLLAGTNLLELPLLPQRVATGDLVARLSHGGSTKTFGVRIEVKPKGGMS